jgi:hypothetical protein
VILGAVQDTTRTGACTSRAHDSENQREPTRDDERQDMGLDLGFLASRCLSQGALKWPQKPSHGRGHWFDPSIAHGKKPLVNGGFCPSERGCRTGRDGSQDAHRTRFGHGALVLFRFMMDIVAPVGVFQVWDAAPVVGRRRFRLLCDTAGFMLL